MCEQDRGIALPALLQRCGDRVDFGVVAADRVSGAGEHLIFNAGPEISRKSDHSDSDRNFVSLLVDRCLVQDDVVVGGLYFDAVPVNVGTHDGHEVLAGHIADLVIHHRLVGVERRL